MGKETCQRSRSDASIRLKWRAFFSLIGSLRMLMFLAFRNFDSEGPVGVISKNGATE